MVAYLNIPDDLGQRQEETLARAAAASNRFKDLLFYHAVLRDFDAIKALESKVLAGHSEDQLTYHLMMDEGAIRDDEDLMALVGEMTDPWVAYTLTKHLLRRDKIPHAVAVSVALAKQGIADTACLNLIARHALHLSEWSVAEKVARRSLRLAPVQQDVVSLLQAAEEKVRPALRPCLKTLPLAARVAYYLPCYNVEDYIASAIEGLLGQCYPLSEILIIDDASPDGSVAIAQGYPVRILHHRENRGLAAARNTAWRNSEAEFLGAIDTDAIPDAGYTKYAMMEYEQGVPELAGVGGRLIEAHTGTPADLWRSIHLSQDPGTERKYMDTPPASKEGLSEVAAEFYFTDHFFLMGCNTLFRRNAFEAVGGYDERYRTNAEDAMFCRCLREQGRHYVFTPHPVAVHDRRDTVRSVLEIAWHYDFWARTHQGFYDSSAQFLQLFHVYRDRAHARINVDIEQQRFDLIYLEFLSMFYSLFLDLRQGIEADMMTPGQAALVQNGVLGAIGGLDVQFGGTLAKKVRADTAHLLVESGIAEEGLDEKAQTQWEECLAYLDGVFAAYTPAIYTFLIG